MVVLKKSDVKFVVLMIRSLASSVIKRRDQGFRSMYCVSHLLDSKNNDMKETGKIKGWGEKRIY